MSKNIFNSLKTNSIKSKTLSGMNFHFFPGCFGRGHNFIRLLLFSFLLLLSCTTQKNLSYLGDIDKTKSESFFPLEHPDYRLQKQDILYVKLTTPNEEINNSLNGGTSITNQNMFQSEIGIYINGYTINDSGFIYLPLVGKVLVLGKTIEEVVREIETKTALFLKEVYVNVKLLSYKITVLGEVKTPGTHYIYNNQVTVLEALAMATDITDFGDRSKILVVRNSKEGSRTFWINMQKNDILSSEAYYLLPNDIIIVYPRRVKPLQMNSLTVSFFLSTIVTTITLGLFLFKI